MEFAKLALSDDMAQFLNSFVIEKRVPNHQDTVPLLRQRHQIFHLTHLDRQRLLDEYMLIRQKRCSGERIMRMHWCGYQDSINIALKYIERIMREPGIVILRLRVGQPVNIHISDKSQRAIR